ncbi:vesicle transport protein SEC20 isoform X3 [Gorilla gorilla gorilla]|uniref:vesicle transport protein SEC20 isoform X3 n=1 Tax=Gorilla gorilla gorilla TaxID=9595 RepID=UPI0030091085
MAGEASRSWQKAKRSKSRLIWMAAGKERACAGKLLFLKPSDLMRLIHYHEKSAGKTHLCNSIISHQDLEQLAKEQDKESEKQLLLQEVENHKKQMLRKTTKESLAQTSSTITESLMGISRMMAQQVQQSEEAMQSLVTSSRTILDANEEFKSMSGTIQLGRKLITKYNRRELTDKLLIFLALALFLATVLYIVKKRLFPFL